MYLWNQAIHGQNMEKYVALTSKQHSLNKLTMHIALDTVLTRISKKHLHVLYALYL